MLRQLDIPIERCAPAARVRARDWTPLLSDCASTDLALPPPLPKFLAALPPTSRTARLGAGQTRRRAAAPWIIVASTAVIAAVGATLLLAWEISLSPDVHADATAHALAANRQAAPLAPGAASRGKQAPTALASRVSVPPVSLARFGEALAPMAAHARSSNVLGPRRQTTKSALLTVEIPVEVGVDGLIRLPFSIDAEAGDTSGTIIQIDGVPQFAHFSVGHRLGRNRWKFTPSQLSSARLHLFADANDRLLLEITVVTPDGKQEPYRAKLIVDRAQRAQIATARAEIAMTVQPLDTVGTKDPLPSLALLPLPAPPEPIASPPSPSTARRTKPIRKETGHAEAARTMREYRPSRTIMSVDTNPTRPPPPHAKAPDVKAPDVPDWARDALSSRQTP